MSQSQKIGGEIGEIRASIDVSKLNAYIEKFVPAICAPVVVKQFKVRLKLNIILVMISDMQAE